MITRLVLAFACVTACGGHALPEQIDGSSNSIPPTITLRGTAFERLAGSAPVSGATVRALGLNQAVLATTTTDATGAYALEIATNGQPVEVALDAIAPSYVLTHRTFESSLIANHDGLWLDLMTGADFASLYANSGVARTSGRATLEVEAADAYGTPLSGAQITTVDQSTSIVYASASGPDPTATATAASGLAYLLDAPADHVDVSATGGFFESDYVTQAFANQLTIFEIDAGFGGD
jgi:hypothetical protein